MVNSLSQLAANGAYGNQNQRNSRISSLMTAAASGNRVTRALDDIASLSVATSLSAETTGLRSAAMNVNQASSFLQVADGGIEQIGGMLDRLSQLSTQANSGAVNDDVREKLNSEFQSLLSEVDRIASDTNFNDVPLLDGSLASDTALRFEQELAAGDVRAEGTSADSLIAQVQGEAASSRIQFADSADINAGDTISISDGAGGAVDFTFVAGAAAAANEIEIGANLEQTLENAAAAVNAFSGANDEGVSQLNASIDGNALVLENQTDGNVVGADGSTVITVATTTGGSVSRATLDNGAAGGIDTRNVTAEGFAGTISGFEADYAGNNQVNLSVRVGEETFRANNVNTNAASDQTVTFTSENGGSFDVTFAAGQGQDVTDPASADGFAARVDAAFSGVSFNQSRELNNFIATGDLAGASLELDGSAFEGVQFAGAAVLNGRLEIEIGGQTYRSADLGDSIGAGERVTLLAENGSESLSFVNGQSRFDISAADGQTSFAQALDEAFGQGAGGTSFQVSASADGALQIGIGDFSTQGLGLDGLDLLSADGAAEAFNAVGAAIGTLTSQRADVGAFQQALDFAGNNIASAVQNQEAARSVLSDADFAAVSTELSLLEAAAEASINTTAQTNRLQDNLLKLIQ